MGVLPKISRKIEEQVDRWFINWLGGNCSNSGKSEAKIVDTQLIHNKRHFHLFNELSYNNACQGLSNQFHSQTNGDYILPNASLLVLFSSLRKNRAVLCFRNVAMIGGGFMSFGEKFTGASIQLVDSRPSKLLLKTNAFLFYLGAIT